MHSKIAEAKLRTMNVRGQEGGSNVLKGVVRVSYSTTSKEILITLEDGRQFKYKGINNIFFHGNIVLKGDSSGIFYQEYYDTTIIRLEFARPVIAKINSETGTVSFEEE